MPTRLQVLILILATFALCIIGWAVWDCAQIPSREWILFTVFAGMTVGLFVVVPAASTVVCFGDTYLMALTMIRGTSSCVIASACYALAISILLRKRLRSPAFPPILSLILRDALHDSPFHSRS